MSIEYALCCREIAVCCVILLEGNTKIKARFSTSILHQLGDNANKD